MKSLVIFLKNNLQGHGSGQSILSQLKLNFIDFQSGVLMNMPVSVLESLSSLHLENDGLL